MAYHHDWLMQQIEAISAMLKFIVSGQKTAIASIEERKNTVSGGNELYLKLHALVAQRKICEAEDLLFSEMENTTLETLDAAIQFYTDLNQLSDEELEHANFSRDEIKTGLDEVCRTYGIAYY